MALTEIRTKVNSHKINIKMGKYKKLRFPIFKATFSFIFEVKILSILCVTVFLIGNVYDGAVLSSPYCL